MGAKGLRRRVVVGAALAAALGTGAAVLGARTTVNGLSEGGEVLWDDLVPGNVAMATVDGRLYVTDFDTIHVLPLDGGPQLHVDDLDYGELRLGEDGRFVTNKQGTLTVWSADGKPTWTVTTTSLPRSIGPEGVSTVECRERETDCAVVMWQDGAESWRWPWPKGAEYQRSTYRGSEEPELVVLPPVAAGPRPWATVPLRDGKPWGEDVPVPRGVGPAHVGDVAVSLHSDGSECVVTSLRAGGTPRESRVDCEGVNLTWVRPIAYPDAVVIRLPAGEVNRIVTVPIVDGEPGEASVVETPDAARGDGRFVSVTPQAVVVEEPDEVRALSPTTGDVLWTRELAADEMTPYKPRVHALDGAVLLDEPTSPWLSRLAVGVDVPERTITLLDAATGEERDQVAIPQRLTTYGLGDGRAVVQAGGDDDRGILLGGRSDG